MSRQYQDQKYQSGHYQTSHPYTPQQHGQFSPPLPNTHNDRPPSHAHSSYPEGSSSDNQWLYPAGAGSDTDGGSNFYSPQPGVQPHHGGVYTATAAQPHAAIYDEGHDSRSKVPRHASKALCRYPHCRNPVFFDRRVNELREWCSDQHMQAAIMHRVEKACNDCGVWPRRNGYKRCSGNTCRYKGY